MKKIIIAAAALASLLFTTGPTLAQSGPATPAAVQIVPVVVASGNTFQALTIPSPRQSLSIENNNSSDYCWVYFMQTSTDTPTKAKSVLLMPGGAYTRYFPFVPNNAIQATCAATSDTLYVDYN